MKDGKEKMDKYDSEAVIMGEVMSAVAKGDMDKARRVAKEYWHAVYSKPPETGFTEFWNRVR